MSVGRTQKGTSVCSGIKVEGGEGTWKEATSESELVDVFEYSESKDS